MAKFTPTAAFSERLAISISAAATTIKISSVLDRDGTALPISATNKGYFTLEPGTSREESIVCTGVNAGTNELTGCVRGLSASGDSETGSSGRAFSHNAGTKIIMTDIAQFFGNFVDTKNAETIAGIKTFSASPIVPTPTTATQAANKSYVDGVAIAGAAKATEVVYGIAKLSSAAADPAAPVVVNNEEVSAAGGAGAGENKVVKANASGYIDKDYIEVTADKGLQFNSNALEVEAGTGIVLNSSGVNVDVGTTASKIVQLDGSAKLPAVDGSQLTGVTTPFAVSTDKVTTYFTAQINPGATSVGATNNGSQITLDDGSNPAYFIGYFPGVADVYLPFDAGKRIILRCLIRLSSTVSPSFSFGIADSVTVASGGTGANAQIRFFHDGTNLMARVGKGTGAGDITTSNITGITLDSLNEYLIDWDGADEAKFYINNTLQATVITNLPKAYTGSMIIQIGTAATKTMSCSPIIASRQL